MRELLGCIDWYRRCLEDVVDGRVVRGLAEAKAGYDAAMREILDSSSGATVAGATEGVEFSFPPPRSGKDAPQLSKTGPVDATRRPARAPAPFGGASG